jgi:hypothetical protein
VLEKLRQLLLVVRADSVTIGPALRLRARLRYDRPNVIPAPSTAQRGLRPERF